MFLNVTLLTQLSLLGVTEPIDIPTPYFIFMFSTRMFSEHVRIYLLLDGFTATASFFHVASTGTFDFGEVLFEAGDDRREVIDGEYRLLLEECVADDRRRVTVIRRPYVVRDGAVFG